MLGEDIPDGDWDAANADALTGTEEDDGDDTEPLYDSEQEEEVGVHLGAPRSIHHRYGLRMGVSESMDCSDPALNQYYASRGGKNKNRSISRGIENPERCFPRADDGC